MKPGFEKPLVALVMAALFMAALAFPAPSAKAQEQGLSQAKPPCACRHRDHDVAFGHTTCIDGKRARCVMVLNNTSWRFEGACPMAGATPDARRGAAPLELPLSSFL